MIKWDCCSVLKAFLSLLFIRFIAAFLFLFSQDNLYMIHLNSDLFYDICNTINEHNHRQTFITTFHLFQIILISIFEWFKKFFYNFICCITYHDLYVITLRMPYRLFILIFRRNKFNCYYFLTLFMSFKYSLTLLRHSSTDSVLFLPSLLSYSI